MTTERFFFIFQREFSTINFHIHIYKSTMWRKRITLIYIYCTYNLEKFHRTHTEAKKLRETKCNISHYLHFSFSFCRVFFCLATFLGVKAWINAINLRFASGIFHGHSENLVTNRKQNTTLSKTHQSETCVHISRVYIAETQKYASNYPYSEIHGANMGPTWVLSASDGSHVGPMNLAIRVFA